MGDKVLVKQTKNEEGTSAAGIIISVAPIKYNRGIVMEVGRDVTEVKKKDSIYFGELSGTYISGLKGEELLMLNEREILAVEL